MKVQEVLLRAMAKKITWLQAAEIIGVSARTMRRWRERLEQDGYDGLADRRKGVVSAKRVSLELCEKVLGLYRDRYYNLNIHEKLREEHGMLSYTCVQKALQGAGLVGLHGDGGLREVIQSKGLSCALYSDRGAIFL